MKRFLLGLIGATALGTLVALPAHASNVAPGLDFTSPGPTGFWSASIGYTFTANAGATVVGLADWMGTDSPVGLWDASGNLIASTTVTGASATIGSAPWYWEPITPITLTPGDNYTVGANNADYTFSETYTTDPRITYVQDAWANNGAGFVYPSNVEGTPGGFPGGNVILAAVPEPARSHCWALAFSASA